MAGERSSAASAIALAVLIVSGAIVLTAFGWYAALNALIPLFMALAWLTVFACACWGAGNLVFHRFLAPHEPLADRVLLQLLGGTAVLVAAAGALGLVRLLKPMPLLLVLGIFCCRGAIVVYRSSSGVRIQLPGFPHWPWLILGIAGAVSLAAATTFASFYDQWHYHLGFPYQWLRAGTLVTFSRQAYSFFPSNMGLLYVYGLAGPGAWAAQLIHWWLGALSVAGTAVIARRLGAPPGGQILAAAIFAATPSVVQVGALAAADLGVAAFAIGSVIALLRLWDDPGRTVFWAGASGVFAGLAAGTKYLALVSVVAPAAIVLAFIAIATKHYGGDPIVRRITRVLVPFAIAVLMVTGPWFARNALETGNPVHPYFAKLFTQAEGSRPRTDEQVASGIGRFGIDGGAIVNALVLGTFNRRGHAGDSGPVHLWLMPLVLIWMWRRCNDATALLVFAVFVLGLGIWAVGPPLARYLIPTLALSAALAGAAWSEIVGRSARPVRYPLGALLFMLLAANCNPVRGEYLGKQLSCALGYQTEESYLLDNCTQLEAFRAANSQLPADAKVLLVGEPRPYGLDRDLVVEDQFRTPLLVEMAESSASAFEIRRRLEDQGITHVLWNGAEADRIAAAAGRTDYLACSSPEARDRLSRFFTDELTVITYGPWWRISALTMG